MADSQFYINVDYDVNKARAEITTNIKREKVADILDDFLRLQIGQGKDSSKAIERDSYSIKIGLDLSFDTFYVTDNTGNKGLRDGILVCAARQYRRDLEKRAG